MWSSRKAQLHTSPIEGIEARTPSFVAFTHARLTIKPGQVIEDGSLVVRDGVIVSSRAGHDVPVGAYEVDLGGKTVFCRLHRSAQRLRTATRTRSPRAVFARRRALHTCAAARRASLEFQDPPRTRSGCVLKPDEKKAALLRKLGYTDVLERPEHGILRGQSAA
jgi:hypothetical protein